MRLIDNKRDRIDDKVFDGICWKLVNARKFNRDICYKQDMQVNTLISSDNLLLNIRDDIRKE